MNAKELYDALKAAGVETDNQNSDLYVKVGEKAGELVKQYEYAKSVTVFRSQIDGGLWYEVPFAYEPFWDDAEKQVEAWAEGVKK